MVESTQLGKELLHVNDVSDKQKLKEFININLILKTIEESSLCGKENAIRGKHV